METRWNDVELAQRLESEVMDILLILLSHNLINRATYEVLKENVYNEKNGKDKLKVLKSLDLYL